MRHAIGLLLAASILCAGCGEEQVAAGRAGEPQDLERFDFRQVVRQAKDKVFPAVVFINVLREEMESGQKKTVAIVGSGVIISPTGEVLTNWHVAEKGVEIRCLLYDGRDANARVLGVDKDTDLALLQLDLPTAGAPLPCGVLGDSDRLKEGDFVMAMGAPWGMERSVSMGIISCTRRYLPHNSEYSLWLQTDASISPGNSGGPLVNTQGEVIGINTRAIMSGGDTGFAVPARTLKEVVSQLRQHGRMNWSWTGLQLQSLRDFQKNIRFDGNEGVIVGGTDPASPARRAGILANDRILRVGTAPVSALAEESLPAVRMELGLLTKQKPVEVEILRAGVKVTVTITPQEKGKVEGEELDCPRWDFTVKAINQFDNPDLYFYQTKGVFVFGIKRPGNAGAAGGLVTQDIILEIDGKEIQTLDDVKAAHKAALENLATKHKATFMVKRNGLPRQVILDYSRDYEKE